MLTGGEFSYPHARIPRHVLQNLRGDEVGGPGQWGLFVTAGVLSHPAGKTTVKLAVPPREQAWWRGLWEKILSPFPNCNAVENRPVLSSWRSGLFSSYCFVPAKSGPV